MDYGYNSLMTPVDGVPANMIPGQPPIGSAPSASPNAAPPSTANPNPAAVPPPTDHPAPPQATLAAPTATAENVVSPANDAPISNPPFTTTAATGVEHTISTVPVPGSAFPDSDYQNALWKLRSIVSSKDAGIIIGKAGKNVAELREATGVKAGVSKVVRGVQNRVLTVEGQLMGIAKAYGLVAKGLAEANVSLPPTPASLSLLISHNQMGTIIGRQGVKIKYIQDTSGVRMVAQKEMLPCSTERVVELRGTHEGIEKAVWEIGKCLIDDRDRYVGTIEYNPAEAETRSFNATPSYDQYTRTGNGADFSERPHLPRPRTDTQRMGLPQLTEDGKEYKIRNVSIPSDMAGCIIGRAGSKVRELRSESGANISIAKEGGDGTHPSERLISVSGSYEAVEKALMLLYETLETEKVRRTNEAQMHEPQE